MARAGSSDQVIFGIPHKLKGYDPKTGQELWSAGIGGSYSYSSPIPVDGHVIYGQTVLKLGGTGDVIKNALKNKVGSMYISTAVVAGDYLYTYSNVGVPACYEWKTGQELWKDQITKRPGGKASWGSLVYAAGRIYIADNTGTTHVFAAGQKYQHLASNHLGNEHMNASLAISGGDIFLRTDEHLWCIGKPVGP